MTFQDMRRWLKARGYQVTDVTAHGGRLLVTLVTEGEAMQLEADLGGQVDAVRAGRMLVIG